MHANARLTPIGRLTMVLRIEGGRPVAHVAAEMGISRPTAYKWWHRWDEFGAEGLVDRSSRPKSCPHRTAPEVEAQIEELRRTLKLGPVRIGYRLGVPASTVHRVLARLGINRLSWMDRPTGQVIRRYERERTGELVHVDIKKLGKIPDGGGWKVLGRAAGIKNNAATEPVVSATDSSFGRRRPQPAGLLGDPWRRAQGDRSRLLGASRGVVRQLGITIEEVLTDNGSCYLSQVFEQVLGDIKHRRPAPTAPRPTAKSSDSTAPCWRNGPTSGPTHQKPNGPGPSAPSCISTIITAATLLLGANHPSTESTTYRVTTTSR